MTERATRPSSKNPDRFTADVANFTETRARRKEAV